MSTQIRLHLKENLSGSTLFAIPLSILRNNCAKSIIWAKKYGIKCLKFFNILPYQKQGVWLVLQVITLHVCFTEVLVFNANSEDPDQMQRPVMSDLGLPCLAIQNYPFGGFPTRMG